MDSVLIMSIKGEEIIKSLGNSPDGIFVLIFTTKDLKNLSVKGYFFNSGKHLVLSEKYINNYSLQKQKIFKTISLCILGIIPFLLIFLLWLTSKH